MLDNPQTIERLDDWLRRDYEARHRRGAYVPTFAGRAHSAATRRVLSQRRFDAHRREAERAGVSKLRRVRLDRGLTIERCASMALISRKAWSRAERGLPVTPLTWARICKSLNVAPSALRD